MPVKTSDDAKTMLRADLENENNTIRAYRERVRQCEAMEEYAALGLDVPDVSRKG